MTSSELGQLGTAVGTHSATNNDDIVCLLLWTEELQKIGNKNIQAHMLQTNLY